MAASAMGEVVMLRMLNENTDRIKKSLKMLEMLEMDVRR
jgi:hypothetical protein